MIAQLLAFDFSVLGFSVLHLAWQGLALGGLAALALRALRHGTPALREAIAGTGLALLVALFAADAARMVAVALELGPRALASPAVRGPDWLADVAPWLGATWLLGFAWQVRRFRRCVATARALRANTTPRGTFGPLPVLASPFLAVPALVGWTRPSIIVPAGVAMDDCILAHELAHFERRDPWTKALARLAVALLWFHPVAHRLAGRLDVERELACDDLALRACGSRARYARALAALERGRSTSVGIAADGTPLLARVQRLLAPGPGLSARVGRARAGLGAAALLALAIVALGAHHPLGPTLPMAVARHHLQRGVLDGAVDHTRIRYRDVTKTPHH